VPRGAITSAGKPRTIVIKPKYQISALRERYGERTIARAERAVTVCAWHKTIGVWLKKGSVTSEGLVS